MKHSLPCRVSEVGQVVPRVSGPATGPDLGRLNLVRSGPAAWVVLLAGIAVLLIADAPFLAERSLSPLVTGAGSLGVIASLALSPGVFGGGDPVSADAAESLQMSRVGLSSFTWVVAAGSMWLFLPLLLEIGMDELTLLCLVLACLLPLVRVGIGLLELARHSPEPTYDCTSAPRRLFLGALTVFFGAIFVHCLLYPCCPIGAVPGFAFDVARVGLVWWVLADLWSMIRRLSWARA